MFSDKGFVMYEKCEMMLSTMKRPKRLRINTRGGLHTSRRTKASHVTCRGWDFQFPVYLTTECTSAVVFYNIDNFLSRFSEF